MTTAPSATPRKRPFTLLVLAGLIMLKAALLVVLVLGSASEQTRPVVAFLQVPGFAAAADGTPGIPALLLSIGALLALSSIGLLSLRRTGWLLAMVLTGLFVAVDINAFLGSGSNHVWMALNILTVFYLNQRDVRVVVGAADTLGPTEAAVP